MRLQSAIFDMDGTLLDSMHIWAHLGETTLREDYGIEPAPDFNDHVRELSLRDGAAWAVKEYHLPCTAEELTRHMMAKVDDFYTNRVQAKPGVKEFLALLKIEGVWMYIATATDRQITEKALRCAGIRDYFRGIVTTDETGCDKHSPEIFERAMRRLQSTKRDTVVFEDAPHAVRCAKDAGFRVCAVYDPSNEAEQEELKAIADYYVKSFEEFTKRD